MKKTRIALVDSGVANVNTLLKSKIVENYMYDRSTHELRKVTDLTDSNGHGTLCASTIIKECPNVEIISIKILNDEGICSLEDVENVFEIILELDVQIVNLSLALMDKANTKRLRSLCNEIYNQNKVIVSSVSNGDNKSYPAVFNKCIGVRGCIMRSEKEIWFNRRKKIQCIVDSTPYLHPIGKDNYILWGKSNSYAAAKVTGIIAREVDSNDFCFENVVASLEEIRTKKYWNRYMLNRSHRLPNINQYKEDCDPIILNKVEKYVSTYLKNEKVGDVRLLSNEGGLAYNDCYHFLKSIQKEFSLEIEDYTEVSREAFYSIYSLSHYIETKMIENEKRN